MWGKLSTTFGLCGLIGGIRLLEILLYLLYQKDLIGTLRKSWRVYHDRSLLGRYFRGFVLPFLEYCSAVWCQAADTHLKLLDRAVSGARFITGGVFECDIAHRQSLAVLCMLYEIRCNAIRPLNGAHPGPYVPVRVTRRALFAYRLVYLCPASQQNLAVPQDFYVLLSVPLERSCGHHIHVVELAGFRSRANCFYWHKLLYSYYILLLFFNFSSFCLQVGIVGLGSSADRVFITLSQRALPNSFNNNNNNLQ